MNQWAPFPETVFRFNTEVEAGSQPAKSKTLRSSKTRQGVETSTFGPSRRSGCAAAEPYLPERQQKTYNADDSVRNQAEQDLNPKLKMLSTTCPQGGPF